MDGSEQTGNRLVNAEQAGGESPAPATISFAAALQRVRSLRQHAALLHHLHEMLITRFLAEGGPGNEPEYVVRLGREEVMVEETLVDRVLQFLFDEVERVRAMQRELESGAVTVTVTVAPEAGDDNGGTAGHVVDRDEVVVNPAAAMSRPQKRTSGGRAT